jgi:lauroyl/myristoyl acyltransferase
MNLFVAEEIESDLVELTMLGMELAAIDISTPVSLRTCATECVRKRLQNEASWLAGSHRPIVTISQLEELRKAKDTGRGSVICLFHIGAWRWLPYEFAALGFSVSLLVDSENYRRLRSMEENLVTRFYVGTPDRVTYIDAELPVASWQMKRSLDAGRLVFVFIDGNSGIVDTEQASHMTRVEFFGRTIRLRPGPAYVSDYSGVPLFLALPSSETKSEFALNVYGPLKRGSPETRDEFSRRVLQQGYDFLRQQCERDLRCWEEWHNLQRWLEWPPNEVESMPRIEVVGTADQLLAFNSKVASILDLSWGSVVINRETGAALAVSKPLRSLLERLRNTCSTREIRKEFGRKLGRKSLDSALINLMNTGALMKVPE